MKLRNLLFVIVILGLISTGAQAAKSCKIQKIRYIKCIKKKKKKVRCKRERRNYIKCRKNYKKSKKRLIRTKRRPKVVPNELIIGIGETKFDMDEILGRKISSTPSNTGFMLGIDLSLSKLGMRYAYITPYVSSYSGGKFSLKNPDEERFEDTTIVEMGINVKNRFYFDKNLYVAPFAGIKMKNIKTKAVEPYVNDFEQNGLMLPIGLNIGNDISKSFGIFAQVTIDVAYLDGEKKIGNYNTNIKTATGPSMLVGIKIKL